MRRIYALIIPFITLTVPMPLMALTLLPTCVDSGNCYTCDFLVLFVNWSQLTMYGLSGMAILMFAIAGFMWILSAGRAEMVQKGRQIMVGTVVGLMFAFLGYTIVNVTIAALLGAGFEEVQLFGTDWASFCESGLTPGGAVQDCGAPGVEDSSTCSTGSCSDEGVCVCLTGSCVSKCDYAVAIADQYAADGASSGTITGTCVDTSAECTAAGGDPQADYCTDGRYCCLQESDTSTP